VNVDRAVDVRLGGEVDDRLCVALLERGSDRRGVLDRPPAEAEARRGRDVCEVLLAPGVGQLVEHRDLVAVLDQTLARERRADEAGAAADEQSHRAAAPDLMS
jgi:hypothetical protein